MAIRQFVDSIAHFENESHERWFYISLSAFVISLILQIFRKTRFPFVFLSLAFSHCFTSISAFVIVVLMQIKSEAYSINCIWFNTVMVVIYIALYGLAIVIKKLKPELKVSTLEEH
jgi:hypothetical protein